MRQKYWLKDIALHKSPGFASGTFPPVAKLGEHLNVIWGPNAVGKSTLSRAMRALIWETKTHGEVEADGLLASPDSEWNLHLAQGKLTQTRLADNQKLRLPGRNDELSESYWFTLHELLQEGDVSTASFLKQVRTSMQGGVDLDGASLDAGGITSFAGGNIAQAKQVRLASEELEQVLKTQNEHQDIQDKMEMVQHKLKASSDLPARKVLLEEAQSLLRLSEAIGIQEQKLSQYSPSIAHVDKSSVKRVQELVSAQAKAQEELRACIQSRDRLTHLFAGCSITEEDLQDGEKPGRIQNQYDALKEALNAQKTAEEAFRSAREGLLEWEREHSWLIDGRSDEHKLQSFVDTLKTLAQECEPLRCDVDANRRLLDELGEPEAIAHSAQELTLLQVRLSDWLDAFWKMQGTPRSKALKPGTRRALLLLVFLIGGIASWLGITVQPAFFLLGVALTLLSVVLLLPSSAKNSEYKKAEEALLQAESEVAKLLKALDKEVPTSWTAEFCHSMTAEAGSEIASIHKLELVNQRRKRSGEQLAQARAKLQKWTSDWQDAVKDLGLKGDEGLLQGAQFFHFAERLKEWSALRLEFVKGQEAFGAAQEESSHALSALQAELETQRCELPALKAMVDSLLKRLAEAHSLQRDIGENEGRLLASQRQLLSSEDALRKFWENVHLAYGDETELTDLVSKLGPWNELKFSLDYDRSLYEQKIEASPRALEMAARHTPSDLVSALETLKLEQMALEAMREELGGLRSTFESLKFSTALSTAYQKQESALSELEAFRSGQVMARMVSTLANELKRESEDLFQPQVLKHASTWLSDITSHRYTLSANNEGFFATDTIMAKNYHLDELSSGTRIQLLFSIRMAFITMQEETSGVSLPIFLDELLANSDDDRALAITQAIGNIAQQRQVFYVTAQRDEVEKLRTVATSDLTVIALEDLKREFRLSQDPLKLYVYDRKEVPQAREDYQGYGRALSVAGASLWSPIEALHSWHLLNDSDELYRFLHQGLERVGQLINARAGQDPSLATRLKLLKSAQLRCQQGRSRGVHLSDLEDPALDLNRGAKFWTQMQEVVGAEGCTGHELLEAVQDKRIQRFTDASLDMLANWLFENRFVSDKESKDAQSILEDLFVEFDALTVGSDEEEIVARYLDAVIGKK